MFSSKKNKKIKKNGSCVGHLNPHYRKEIVIFFPGCFSFPVRRTVSDYVIRASSAFIYRIYTHVVLSVINNNSHKAPVNFIENLIYFVSNMNSYTHTYTHGSTKMPLPNQQKYLCINTRIMFLIINFKSIIPTILRENNIYL